jgi:hypothetical protein
MTEHKDIQNPAHYTEEDYMEFRAKLFSPVTPVSELEDICMTLAHLPTKEAQDLLTAFRESGRADEVSWLECAADEGQYHYLSPTNEQEKRDYLALKVLQEMEDDIVDLEVKRDELQLELDKKNIEYEAIQALVKSGELDEIQEAAFHDYKLSTEFQMEELTEQISVKEKIFSQIKQSVKTEKYKNVNPMYMRNIHF